MACGDNGCNGKIVTNKLLDVNGLTFLKNLFNGKLFSIWGSLTAKGEKPIKVDQSIGTAGETIVTVSADEAYKDDSGEYHSGIMSATDKAFIDGLSGTMSGLMVVATDANGNIIGVNGVDLLFVGTELSKTFYLTAYSGGKKVDITEASFPASPFARGGINDGVLTVGVSRAYALTTLKATTPLTVVCGSLSTRIYLSATSDSQCYDVLKGQVYVENNKMTGTLWTFDGSEPAIRYVRGGAYWVNLPESWKDLLGDFDETRLFVQVTMAGKSVAAHVYCGRYDAGEEYNGDKASTDCWGAILILTSNVENVAVDGSFYISVAYLPSVGTYEAENESDVTYQLRVEDFYYSPLLGGDKNTIGYEGGSLRPVLSLMLDKYVDGVFDSSEAVEAESTTYSGSDEYETDTSTGVITFVRNVHGYVLRADMFVDITAVSPNGEFLTADAMVLDITQEASPTYIQIEGFEYPTIPPAGGTVEPSLIGVYYHDTTTGMAVGVNAGCTFEYSVSPATIATMVNEATGEMAVEANDTGEARDLHITVKVTYERDGLTYSETETIIVSQESE